MGVRRTCDSLSKAKTHLSKKKKKKKKKRNKRAQTFFLIYQQMSDRTSVT